MKYLAKFSLTCPARLLAGPLVLLPLAGRAQLSLGTISPARNAVAASAGGPAVLTFSQALNAGTAASVRVFSSQHGGQLVGTHAMATASGSTLTVQPAARLKPGETVLVNVPATVTGSTGAAAAPQVYQYTVAVAGGEALFAGTAAVPVGQGPSSLAVADVDGDGDLDLLTSNTAPGTPNTVSVRLNDGQGNFTGSTAVPVGARPFGLAMADIDGDGDLDIVTPNANSFGASLSTLFKKFSRSAY